MAATFFAISCLIRCVWSIDRIGFFALLALVYLGGGLLTGLIRPFVSFYLTILGKF